MNNPAACFRLWIGISDGYTPGVFRGSDTLAITWADWGINEPYLGFNGHCVYVFLGKVYCSICDRRMAFICQSQPGNSFSAFVLVERKLPLNVC